MTLNDFNSQIDFPYYCEDNGIKGLTFINMSRFGWFGWNNTTQTAVRLVDLIPAKEIVGVLHDIILSKPQYHIRPIRFSEQGLTKLCNDVRINFALRAFINDAETEFRSGLVQPQPGIGKKNIRNLFISSGLVGVDNLRLGVVTPSLFQKYHTALRLNNSVKHKLLLPSWCTPSHFCTLEHAPITQIHEAKPLFVNREKGWYGSPAGFIRSNVRELLSTSDAGCTWDHKLNHWATGGLTPTLSLNVSQCLKVWKEAATVNLTKSPLDIIEETGKIESLEHHVGQLTFDQVTKLEERFSVTLQPAWMAQRTEQVVIGQMTFLHKDMRYYYEDKHGNLQEFTNFALEIDGIVKKNNKFYREGTIYFEGKQEFFSIPNDRFLSTRSLMKSLTELFLNKGLGIPVVTYIYSGYLIDVINKLNMTSLIDPLAEKVIQPHPVGP